MVNLLATATDDLASSATGLTDGLGQNVPIIGNAALCADSLCTTGRGARKLRVSTVERLISAVTKLTQQEDVDLLMINLTKSRGQDQSLSDVFASVEYIKNAYIVDTLYGKYIESIFEPPIILFFTNERLDDHLSSLSPDRWLRLNINSNYTIEHRITNQDGTVTPISLKDLNIKK